MWILWKMRFWKCEFCEKWDFQNVNFRINWGFLPQCASLEIVFFPCRSMPNLFVRLLPAIFVSRRAHILREMFILRPFSMKNKYCWQTETCVTQQQSYGFIIHFQVSQTEIRQLYVSYIRHLFTSLLFHAWKRSDQKGERTLNNLWRRGPKHPKFPHEYKQAKIRSTQQQLRLWRHLQLLFFSLVIMTILVHTQESPLD